MTTKLRNSLKTALRKRMKDEILKSISATSRDQQSKAVTQKVLQSEAFRNAQRISVYLSTNTEINTETLVHEMFRLNKQVYVPSYSGKVMEMLRLKDLHDYQTLPLTKWNIKQPNISDKRDNALTNGHGIDLFLMPGVAFTLNGGRLGHGMGYYDAYLRRHQVTYPQKKVILMALSFQEQIVDDAQLPLEDHDVRLHTIITE